MTQKPASERGEQRGSVAVVVLTWNALEHTKACLDALAGTDHPAWRVIAVDNGSTDGTVEWLRGLGWVEVVANPRNLGFTKGCNLGMARTAPDEDVVLLNNDLIVGGPSWLGDLQDVASAHPSAGVIGTRLVDPQGLVSHLGSYMPPRSLWGQQLGGLELDVNQARRARPVEAVVFAQVYLTRRCIDTIGVLDETYFSYFEDTDYCLRATRAGFEVLYAGSVCSTHVGNASTRENNVDFWSMYNRSARTFRKQWASWLEDGRYEGDVVWHSILHRAPGYALQSKKLMTALHFAGLKVAYRNAYGEDDGESDSALINDLLKRPVRDDVPQVGFCQADVFPGIEGTGPATPLRGPLGPRVGWTMLEVNGLPQEWVDGCNGMDEVWVPAAFNEESFRASGVRVPIRVMPLGVDVDYFNPGITGFRPTSRFTFLSVFEWGERKGADLLLRAFAEEFKEPEDVLLLLAVYNRDPGVDVHEELAKLRLPASPPIVIMLNPEFADPQMGALYRSADCFVLPSRGEGWGMPVLEAMACGLPVISTAWSGPADFLHPGVGYPLEVKAMVKAVAKCPWYEGFEWAEPDFDHLRFLLREVVDRPDQARARGLAAAAEVAGRYTIEHAAARVKARLLELR